jgi:hypothetical protein
MKKAILYPILALVITLSLTLAMAIPAMAASSISVTVTATPANVYSGDQVTVEVVVLNNGTYDLENVHVSIGAPFNIEYDHPVDLLVGEFIDWTLYTNISVPTTFSASASGISVSSCPTLREDSDEASVGILTCNGGCTLTPGYWKTHSEYGPAPYDDTWAQLAGGADTPFFLSGQSYYEVLWTSPKGNAYYILAHAYIAAELNFLNGANPSAAQAAFDEATSLFGTYSPAEIAALKGNNPLRANFLELATILDDYNNGIIGPGHCSD